MLKVPAQLSPFSMPMHRRNEQNLRSFLSRTSLLLLILSLLALLRGDVVKLSGEIRGRIRGLAKTHLGNYFDTKKFLKGLDGGKPYAYHTFPAAETKWPISELDNMKLFFREVALVLADYPDAQNQLNTLMCYRYAEVQVLDKKEQVREEFFKQTDTAGRFFIFENSGDYASAYSQDKFMILEALLARIEEFGGLEGYRFEDNKNFPLDTVKKQLSDAFGGKDAVGFMGKISDFFPRICDLINYKLCSNWRVMSANFPGLTSALEEDLRENRSNLFNAVFRLFPGPEYSAICELFVEFFMEQLNKPSFLEDKRKFNFFKATLGSCADFNPEAVKDFMMSCLHVLEGEKKWHVLRDKRFLGCISENIRKTFYDNYMEELLELVEMKDKFGKTESKTAKEMLENCRDGSKIPKELFSLTDGELEELYIKAFSSGTLEDLKDSFPPETVAKMELLEESKLNEMLQMLTQARLPQKEMGHREETNLAVAQTV
jgi:hypothetical protein